jgi:hypothetical protein
MTIFSSRDDSVVNANQASKADVLTQYVIGHGEIEGAEPEHIAANANVQLLSMLDRAGT